MTKTEVEEQQQEIKAETPLSNDAGLARHTRAIQEEEAEIKKRDLSYEAMRSEFAACRWALKALARDKSFKKENPGGVPEGDLVSRMVTTIPKLWKQLRQRQQSTLNASSEAAKANIERGQFNEGEIEVAVRVYQADPFDRNMINEDMAKIIHERMQYPTYDDDYIKSKGRMIRKGRKNGYPPEERKLSAGQVLKIVKRVRANIRREEKQAMKQRQQERRHSRR